MSVQFLKSAGLSVMTSQTDRPSKKKRRTPWYVYFGGSTIYTAPWRVAGRRIVSSSDYLHHQRAGGIFLCLESLETRETRQS